MSSEKKFFRICADWVLHCGSVRNDRKKKPFHSNVHLFVYQKCTGDLPRLQCLGVDIMYPNFRNGADVARICSGERSHVSPQKFEPVTRRVQPGIEP